MDDATVRDAQRTTPARETRRLRPAEAAARLGLAASTLRLYSVRFAALLSPGAAAPTPATGRHGHRSYSVDDLEVLQQAKALIDEGLTYDEALARLTHLGGPDHVAQSAPDPAALRIYLDAFQRTVKAWEELAEERSREVTMLRRRTGELEAIAEERAREVMTLRARVGELEAIAEEQWREIVQLRERVGELERSRTTPEQARAEPDQPSRPWLRRLLGTPITREDMNDG